MPIDLIYGRHGRFTSEIDPRRVVLHHPGPGQCAGFATKVRKALSTPLDFPSLVQVCVPGDQVVLALDRHTPGAAELVGEVWGMLERRGIDASAVHILQPAALDGVPLADPRMGLPESVRREVHWTVHDP